MSIKGHDSIIKEANKIRYLGDILPISGNLDEKLDNTSIEAIGIRSKLKALISEISLGHWNFEVCMIMGEAVYLNSILVNCKAWYSMTMKQISVLGSAHILYLLIWFGNYNPKTVKDSFYPETGTLKNKTHSS